MAEGSTVISGFGPSSGPSVTPLWVLIALDSTPIRPDVSVRGSKRLPDSRLPFCSRDGLLEGDGAFDPCSLVIAV